MRKKRRAKAARQERPPGAGPHTDEGLGPLAADCGRGPKGGRERADPKRSGGPKSEARGARRPGLHHHPGEARSAWRCMPPGYTLCVAHGPEGHSM